jgi:hypothetical protein
MAQVLCFQVCGSRLFCKRGPPNPVLDFRRSRRKPRSVETTLLRLRRLTDPVIVDDANQPLLTLE